MNSLFDDVDRCIRVYFYVWDRCLAHSFIPLIIDRIIVERTIKKHDHGWADIEEGLE